jgi:RNA polymerase primary sigma factor
MYLKQMGQVPLLTREQEVEISKRIEDAENEVKRIIYSFGFSGKEHIALAEKLISEPPKERFDRVIVDKKIETRDEHLKALRKLVKEVRPSTMEVDSRWHELQDANASKAKQEKVLAEFKKLDEKLQRSFPKFYYKQKVIEEMCPRRGQHPRQVPDVSSPDDQGPGTPEGRPRRRRPSSTRRNARLRPSRSSSA